MLSPMNWQPGDQGLQSDTNGQRCHRRVRPADPGADGVSLPGSAQTRAGWCRDAEEEEGQAGAGATRSRESREEEGAVDSR